MRLLTIIFTFISFGLIAQTGSINFSVGRSKVTDSATVTMPSGYGGLRFKNQASQTKWQFTNDGTNWFRLIGGNILNNYVPKFNSTTGVLTNSQIFDNGTSVGVNVASPHSTTRLGSSGNIDIYDVNNGAFRIFNGTTLVGGLGTGLWAGFGTASDVAVSANDDVHFHTNGSATPSMVILDDGRIGMGVSLPNASTKLGVNGRIDIYDVNNGAFRIYDGTNLRGGIGTGLWAGFGTASDIGVFAEDDLSFHTGSSATPSAVISDSGDFGIGDTSPSFKLDVNGTIASQSLTAGRLPITSTGGSLIDEAALEYDITNNAVIVTNSAATFVSAYYGGEIQFDHVSAGDDLTINQSGIIRSDASSPGGDTFTITNNSGVLSLSSSSYTSVDGFVTKEIQIGSWNMDTNSTGPTVLHGVDYTTIRSVSVTIQRDDLAVIYFLDGNYSVGGANVAGSFAISSTQIALERVSGQIFDSADFDGSSNRGYVTIVYKP